MSKCVCLGNIVDCVLDVMLEAAVAAARNLNVNDIQNLCLETN